MCRYLHRWSTSFCPMTSSPGGSATSRSVINFIRVLATVNSSSTWSTVAMPSESGILFKILLVKYENWQRPTILFFLRTYVDAVINHMTGLGRVGTSYDGSTYDGDAHDFPGVPFSLEHFTPKNLCPSGDGNCARAKFKGT